MYSVVILIYETRVLSHFVKVLHFVIKFNYKVQNLYIIHYYVN